MQDDEFRSALDAFLASQAFEEVVRDNLGQVPFVQRVVELHRDGRFTIYSQYADAVAAPDTLILGIPLGEPDAVRKALREEFAGKHA
jgi:hypothetical protein